jgi:hypothetical protein
VNLNQNAFEQYNLKPVRFARIGLLMVAKLGLDRLAPEEQANPMTLRRFLLHGGRSHLTRYYREAI